jgi:di/tricarboxylate transporter
MGIAIVLGLLVLAIVLFATERISVDVVTLLVLVVLVLCGILEPGEAFRASRARSWSCSARSS